jgi:alcohol dehydrogenase class IV
LIFEALLRLKNPNNVLYRHKLHNAATLAGMAIGNASVGVNHALAHALGARFDIPHGRANGAFLLSTIEYNAQIPSKFVSIPCYPLWVADRKYARAAQFIGKDDAPAARTPASPMPPARGLANQCRTGALIAPRCCLGRLAGQPLSQRAGHTVRAYQAALSW